MSTLTKAQLLSQLEAAHVEIASLRNQLVAVRPTPRVRMAYAHHATEAQVRAHEEYVAKLNAARELAMRDGKSTVVR